MTPKAAIARLRRIKATLTPALIRAEEENLRDALRAAEQLSSGAFSTTELRRMGHPYARRNPRPPADPAIINVQRGDFRAGWHIRAPRKVGRKIAGRLENIDPKAGFMHGTRRMIPRPIGKAIMRLIAKKRAKRLRAAVRAALRTS